jgi:chromosome segregation ATPase
MKQMFEELNAHTEELNAQKEEMHQNLEEMTATQEEITRIRQQEEQKEKEFTEQSILLKKLESEKKALQEKCNELQKKLDKYSDNK